MDASALDKAISILEKEISKLEVSIDDLEKWLWISSVAVAVGVIFEIAFLIHEYLEDRASWRRGILVTPSRPSLRILSLEIASVLLVVAGIVEELWVGVASANRNTEPRSKNNRLVGLVREKAGKAEVTAGDAKERAGKLEKEAGALHRQAASLLLDVASANANAEEARSMAKSAELARAELEARIAPRTLDLPQRKSIGDALRVFAITFSARQVKLEWQAIDIEATILGVEIRDAISRAGIQSDGPTAGLRMGGPVIIGLTITGPTKDEGFVRVIYSLLHADLPRENISAEASPKFDTAPVTITIGFKTPQEGIN